VLNPELMQNLFGDREPDAAAAGLSPAAAVVLPPRPGS
jgi:hypothetical protein